MTRKIIALAATALGIGALSFAPRVADAQVTVSADVASTAVMTAHTDVATTTWTGIAAEADPFTVTVDSNDAAGYTFTFTGTNSAVPPFEAIGTAVPGNIVDYTVTDAAPFTYVNGTAGTEIFPGPTVAAGVASTFDVNWPVQVNVPSDTYTDTLIVALNPQ